MLFLRENRLNCFWKKRRDDVLRWAKEQLLLSFPISLLFFLRLNANIDLISSHHSFSIITIKFMYHFVINPKDQQKMRESQYCNGLPTYAPLSVPHCIQPLSLSSKTFASQTNRYSFTYSIPSYPLSNPKKKNQDK